MNQILDYNPNKGSGGGHSSGSDKIVRVFAVILAIFAVALLGVGGYGIYKNKVKSNIPTQAASKAEIKVEQQETTALVDVTHDKVIEKFRKRNNNKRNRRISYAYRSSSFCW